MDKDGKTIGGIVEDDDIEALSCGEIEAAASEVRQVNSVADGRMDADMTGPISLDLNGELNERFPEADLAGLVTQLRHSIDGCPNYVYEYNQAVGVHAGEVTPQTIEALGLVVESLLEASGHAG